MSSPKQSRRMRRRRSIRTQSIRRAAGTGNAERSSATGPEGVVFSPGNVSGDLRAPGMPTQAPEGPEDNGHADAAPRPDSGAHPPADKKILYRLHCNDQNSKTNIVRYSWAPFKGLHESHAEKEERQNLAVFDVMDVISGEHMGKSHRMHQHRRNFWETDPDDFVVGKHFRLSSYEPTGIRIHSSYISGVLQGLISYYPGVNFTGGSVVESGVYFEEPYKEVFHYWDSLHKVLDASCGNSDVQIVVEKPLGTAYSPDVHINCRNRTYEHLKTLLKSQVIQDTWEGLVMPEKKRNERGMTRFTSVWLLFKPGCIVFAKGDDTSKTVAGYIVMDIQYKPSTADELPDAFNPADHWHLRLWNLAYDNGHLRRRTHAVDIYRFHGEKAIAELPAFPTTYAADQQSLCANMIERGKRYYKIISQEPCHMKYNGLVLSDKPYFYRGEIIVDHKGFKHGNDGQHSLGPEDKEPDDFQGGPLFSKLNNMKCSVGTELEPDQYLLLSGNVQGFAMEKRVWATFDMDFVTDVVFENDPMRHLIIESDKKTLIQATAGQPRQGMSLEAWAVDWDADFVEGKGRGRVVLLHGSPGTGKTLTAELISKKTHRPLLRLSAADLGTHEVNMESRLTMWLDRATNWGAIVLIDEAEIYLEQRNEGQVSRNALVAAFLRTLEYFPGLLFLTTNSIGLIDEAVMSRIHLAIGYRPPQKKQREQIWYELFDKLNSDQDHETQSVFRTGMGDLGENVGTAKPIIKVLSSARDVIERDAFAEMSLNGRDIRNLLLSAISLARDGSHGSTVPRVIEVTSQHLTRVLDNKKAFLSAYKLATNFTPDMHAAEHYRRGLTDSLAGTF